MAEEQSEARKTQGEEEEQHKNGSNGAGAGGTESGEGETASGDQSPQTREEELESALEEARAELEKARAEQLRALAELENVRKRARRDVESAHRFGIEKFAAELANVKDSLEMGLDAARGDNPSLDQLIEGKETTLRQLEKVFEGFGVSELNPEGEAFDPEYHEAMTTQPSTEAEAGTVLQVFQKGYVLNGRLLRPARVIVASEPETGESGADQA